MSTLWVSRAVDAAAAEATQQPATKIATGIQPFGPSPTRLALTSGVKPAARKPSWVPIAVPE